MGLYIQSLENIPLSARRDYFIYLLDYGWNRYEYLGDALKNNYEKMAGIAAENRAVVIRGTDRIHFEDEVLSWHHINGENAEGVLPAILITNKHPDQFRQKASAQEVKADANLKMIFIPLHQCCKTESDVLLLIEKLFNDIKAGKNLDDFRIASEKKKGIGKALIDALILEPNYCGIGFSFNKLIQYFKH